MAFFTIWLMGPHTSFAVTIHQGLGLTAESGCFSGCPVVRAGALGVRHGGCHTALHVRATCWKSKLTAHPVSTKAQHSNI